MILLRWATSPPPPCPISPGVPDQRPRCTGANPCGGVPCSALGCFLPAYRIGAPSARASAHAGGVLLFVPAGRWPGGSRAPLFRSVRTWAGAAGGRGEGRRRRPCYGQPERSEGKGPDGTTGGSQVGLRARSKSPERKRRVDANRAMRFASRGAGCAGQPYHKVVRLTPPLMPFVISGPIFPCCVENTALPGLSMLSGGPQLQYDGGPPVGHVVHIPPGIVVALWGTVAHGERLQ